jgi:hypothetical protein
LTTFFCEQNRNEYIKKKTKKNKNINSERNSSARRLCIHPLKAYQASFEESGKVVFHCFRNARWHNCTGRTLESPLLLTVAVAPPSTTQQFEQLGSCALLSLAAVNDWCHTMLAIEEYAHYYLRETRTQRAQAAFQQSAQQLLRTRRNSISARSGSSSRCFIGVRLTGIAQHLVRLVAGDKHGLTVDGDDDFG